MPNFAEQFLEDDQIVLEADADLSTKQFYFVKLSSDGQVAYCSATDDLPIGILQNDPDAAAEDAKILPCNSGKISKLTVDGTSAISVGSKLDTDAAGKGVVHTTGHFFAIALEASTAATDVIPVILLSGTLPKV